MDAKRKENLIEAVLMAAERGEDAPGGIDAAGDIGILVEEGLLIRDGARVELTPEGRAIAESVTRRHRLAEVMLTMFLGIDKERASEIGCIVEHDIMPEMVDSICTILGHPSSCPHGRPIPPGSCCRAGRTVVPSQVVPLTQLESGEKGRIIYITPRDHQRLHRLASLGITPGVVVEIHGRSPAFCIHFEGTDIALDKDVAGDIHVTRVHDAG